MYKASFRSTSKMDSSQKFPCERDSFRFYESSDAEENDDEGISPSIDTEGTSLSISEEHARANYQAAGTMVKEEADSLSVSDNEKLIDPEVDKILTHILDDLALPYQISDFQRVSVNVLGSMKHLVLVSPTGSGKMDVPLLSALVLREKLGIKKGVAIVTQPLSSIMNQKLKNRICDAAVLTMTGQVKTSNDEESANLSCDLDDLLAGKYPVLIGHPESFDSPMGRSILKELLRLGLLILVCIDEFHQACFRKISYLNVYQTPISYVIQERLYC